MELTWKNLVAYLHWQSDQDGFEDIYIYNDFDGTEMGLDGCIREEDFNKFLAVQQTAGQEPKPHEKVFRTECDEIDVTSSSRPDLSWKCTDKAGHEHRWYGAYGPTSFYDPSATYTLPTLKFVVDHNDIRANDYPETGHYECTICNETVAPAYCADPFRQKIPGVTSYYVDDTPVTQDEYRRQLKEQQDTKENTL